MLAKTYDRQSGKLVARIAENLPEMSGEVMQGWIDNPKGLQKFLLGLCLSIWTVVYDGRDAKKLIRDLENKGRRVSDLAKEIMSKTEFGSIRRTYRLVVIRGDEFLDTERTTANIFAEGARLGYLKPSVVVAPLLREKFTQGELGFPYVVVMHEPIIASDGYSELLALRRADDGEWLDAWHAGLDRQWYRGPVFVFLASQD